MGLNTESSAALVYLVLYTILFVVLILGYITGNLKLRSRYSVLTFHVSVRIASQATGLAFGIVGFANPQLLTAYFVLGAEGYFTLVLSAYRFLISWQNHNLASHSSWLEPRQAPGVPRLERLRQAFAIFGAHPRPMSFMHNFLLVANALIITGGSLLAAAVGNTPELDARMPTAKGLRTAGQAVFLAINAFLLYCICNVIRQSRRENPSKRTHATLLVLLAVWPFLFVRGLYGVLAGLVPAFNYFDPANYGEAGLKDAFVISEYILGTTMEWTSCAMLMCTFFTSRNDPKKAELEMEEIQALRQEGEA